MKWTSKKITALLRELHADDIFFAELRAGAGWGVDSERRIDAYAMSPYPSKHNVRTAYEIKVSKRDYVRELSKPLKRRPALLYANQFYFVAPKGVIDPRDVPIECGLIEVLNDDPNRHVVTKFERTVTAPWRETDAPTWRFVASMLRRSMTACPCCSAPLLAEVG